MCIKIDELLVTQNGLRNLSQIPKMIEFVKAGGYFSRDGLLAWKIFTGTHNVGPPIHIAIMEDGQKVLHDGHHRALAICQAGRNYISYLECVQVKYTYLDYSLPCPEKDWFTPFDIPSEVRVPDFYLFKAKAKLIYKHAGLESFKNFIGQNRRQYVERRKVWTVKELSNRYLNLGFNFKKDEQCQSYVK